MIRKIKHLAALILVIIAADACTVVEQAQQAAILANCDFRIRTVENITLGGVNVQNIRNVSDLTMTDLARLTAALTKPSVPLNMKLNIEGRNPNAASAGLNRLDYILLIDDIEMTRGILDQSFVIPPNNGSTVIPLQLTFDLKKVLTGKSLDAVMNFGLNLAGVGNKPTRIKVKLKPTILVGAVQLQYPGYITIGTDFSSPR